MTCQWKGIGWEWKFFGVVQAKEDVGDGGGRIIDNFNGLNVISPELDDLRFDRYYVSSHASVKLKLIL